MTITDTKIAGDLRSALAMESLIVIEVPHKPEFDWRSSSASVQAVERPLRQSVFFMDCTNTAIDGTIRHIYEWTVGTVMGWSHGHVDASRTHWAANRARAPWVCAVAVVLARKTVKENRVRREKTKRQVMLFSFFARKEEKRENHQDKRKNSEKDKSKQRLESP